MIFRLVEDAPHLSNNLTQEFNHADDKRRKEIIWEVIKKYNNPSLGNLFGAIYISAINSGLDPKLNDFLNLISELKFSPKRFAHEENFKQLATLWMKNGIDMSKDYLRREEIYSVKPKDFYYVVNLFDIVNNPSKLSSYFNDTKGIDESALYDEQGNLKPVGKNGDGIDTLFGTVQSWSGNDGENDKDGNQKQIKVTATQLKQAKQKPYDTFEDIPKSEYKEGNIAYVKFLKHESDYVNLEDWVDDFFIFRSGKWSKLN